MADGQNNFFRSAEDRRRTYREAFLPDELKHRFGSKEDLLIYFSEQRKSISDHLTSHSIYIVQLFVPPMATVNRDFVRAVLQGEKKLLKISEKRSVNVPKYDELSVKNIFPKFKRDAKVMQFL